MNAASNEESAAPPVLFERRATAGGLCLGIATLNAPRTLNGLSLAMVQLLDAQLAAWAEDDAVAVVVLQGAGEKAFCAGGDLHGLYRGMREFAASGSADITRNRHASEFFATEYRLDHRIHKYTKPLLCWGHGIVMGGGIGLMAGASHRVVSERSRLAFPEISIGLFPDVGGSALLSRLQGRAGLFLALTGAPLDAGDAIHAGLADVQVAEGGRRDVFAALAAERWSGEAAADRQRLGELLARFAVATAQGPLQRHAQRIAEACAGDDLDAIAQAIASIDSADAWLRSAQATLAAGAPGSARLGFELQRRAAALPLAEVFRLEYVVALRCAAYGDFAEGIRALLIDKDRQPRWNPALLGEATQAWSGAFFRAPAWPGGVHPLADLGRADGARA